MIKILHRPMAVDALQFIASYKPTFLNIQEELKGKRNENLQYAVKSVC